MLGSSVFIRVHVWERECAYTLGNALLWGCLNMCEWDSKCMQIQAYLKIQG